VANSHYAVGLDLVPRQKARSEEIETELASIEAGFDSVEADATALEAALETEIHTWTSAVDAGGYALTNLPAPAVASAAATKSWVETEIAAEILLGGTPGNVSITSLGVGTATASQALEINAAGTAVVGATRLREQAAANIYAHANFGGL
jgi:hypothetical protein